MRNRICLLTVACVLVLIIAGYAPAQCANGQCTVVKRQPVQNAVAVTASVVSTAANVVRNVAAVPVQFVAQNKPVRTVAAVPVRVLQAQPIRTALRRVFCR